MNPKNKIYKDYVFLGKNKFFSFLLICLAVLNSLDWSLTYYGVENRGFREANELFRNCINKEGNYMTVLIAKTSFTFLSILVIYFIFKYYSRLFGYILISAINLYYLMAVFGWIILLV